MKVLDHLNVPLMDRVREAIGTRDLMDLEERLTSLEVAVPENAALESALESLVADLERAVAQVAARHAGNEMGA